MAGILISPKVDIQIRNKNAAYRKKFGSPNFRDLLRQRCRERIKARRGALFNSVRGHPFGGHVNCEDEVRSALSDMMHSDVKDIIGIRTTNSCIPHDSLIHLQSKFQILGKTETAMSISMDVDTDMAFDEQSHLCSQPNQQEKYLMEMYEQLLESERAMIDALLKDDLICPLCEKGIFTNHSGMLKCTRCPATLHSSASPSHIKQLIDSALTTHDQFCSKEVSFAIFTEQDVHDDGDGMQGLFMICDSCAYFVHII